MSEHVLSKNRMKENCPICYTSKTTYLPCPTKGCSYVSMECGELFAEITAYYSIIKELSEDPELAYFDKWEFKAQEHVIKSIRLMVDDSLEVSSLTKDQEQARREQIVYGTLPTLLKGSEFQNMTEVGRRRLVAREELITELINMLGSFDLCPSDLEDHFKIPICVQVQSIT